MIGLGLCICMYITDVQVYVLDFICLLKVYDPGMIVVARWSLFSLSNFDI